MMKPTMLVVSMLALLFALAAGAQAQTSTNVTVPAMFTVRDYETAPFFTDTNGQSCVLVRGGPAPFWNLHSYNLVTGERWSLEPAIVGGVWPFLVSNSAVTVFSDGPFVPRAQFWTTTNRQPPAAQHVVSDHAMFGATRLMDGRIASAWLKVQSNCTFWITVAVGDGQTAPMRTKDFFVQAAESSCMPHDPKGAVVESWTPGNVLILNTRDSCPVVSATEIRLSDLSCVWSNASWLGGVWGEYAPVSAVRAPDGTVWVLTVVWSPERASVPRPTLHECRGPTDIRVHQFSTEKGVTAYVALTRSGDRVVAGKVESIVGATTNCNLRVYLHHNDDTLDVLFDYTLRTAGGEAGCAGVDVTNGLIQVAWYDVGGTAQVFRAIDASLPTPPPPPCTFSLLTNSAAFPAGGGTGTINIRTESNCYWYVTENAPWLQVYASRSGYGNGFSVYTVAANATTNGRVGTLSVQGMTFTVMQAGSVPPPPVLTAPYLSYKLAGKNLQLRWTQAKSPDGIVSYEIWKDSARIASVNAGTFSYNLKTKHGEFQVKAIDGAGRSIPSNTVRL